MMGKGKPGKGRPASFAERGLVRSRAADVSEQLRKEICAAVLGARPLELSNEAIRTVRCVSEIYMRRGFQSLSERELSKPVDLTLEYVDCRGTGPQAGSWESAAFLVVTSCGSWRMDKT